MSIETAADGPITEAEQVFLRICTDCTRTMKYHAIGLAGSILRRGSPSLFLTPLFRLAGFGLVFLRPQPAAAEMFSFGEGNFLAFLLSSWGALAMNYRTELGWLAACVALLLAFAFRLRERWALAQAREVIQRICRGDYDDVQTLVERPGVGHLREELGVMARQINETTVSREYFQQVVEGIPGALVASDASGRITLWNEQARQITGYSSDEVVGKRCSELGIFRCGTEEYPCPRESGYPLLQVEMPLVRRDGVEIVVSKSSDLLPESDGSPPGTIEVFIDISEKKRYEDQLLEQQAELPASRGTALQALDDLRRTLRQLEQARDAAEVASRMKSQFLANVSHEIRTPLNAILGFAQLLRESPLFPEDAHYVETIVRSGGHLKELIDQVLDVSKIEAGKLEMNAQRFDPRVLAASVEHMLRAKAQSKGISFDCDVSAEMPEQLCGDSTRLRQILINLAGNAVKFTERGGVRVRLGWSDGEMVLTVADSGPGIPDDERVRIFEPFYQADGSTTRRHGGAGLGLAIVRGLVTAMGGQLSVDSEIGWGSTFVVRVPGLIADGSTDPCDGEALRQPGHASGAGRVLLVEDDRASAMLAQVILERAGYEVKWAAGGEEGLDCFALGGWDAVLLDMQMPDVDGYEVARRIRRSDQGSSVPIIALTAHATDGDRERCLDAGCSEYLTKPLDVSKLLQLLATCTTSTTGNAELNGEFPGGNGRITQLRQEYLQRVAEEVKLRLEALDRSDFDRLAASAHTWKGSGGTYGYPGITDRSAVLERAAVAGDSDGAERCLRDLEDHLRFLRAQMERSSGTAAAPAVEVAPAEPADRVDRVVSANHH